MATAFKTRVMLIGLHAVVILLSGMILIISQTTPTAAITKSVITVTPPAVMLETVTSARPSNWPEAVRRCISFFKWIWIPLGGLTALLVAVLLYRRRGIASARSLTTAVIIIAIGIAAVLTSPKVYRWLKDRTASSPPPSMKLVPALPQPAAASSRVTTRTIIARPDGSETISILPNHWFRCLPQEGCIEGRTRRGYTWKECPGEGGPHLGDRIQVLDLMLSFRSLEEGNVDVICDWEPK